MEYYSNKIIAVNVKEPEKIINKSNTYISSLKESFNGLEDSKRISDILYSLAKLKNDMRFFSEPELDVYKRQVYYKEKNESLWDIGKKNLIAKEDILKMNDFESEEDILESCPLIIK